MHPHDTLDGVEEDAMIQNRFGVRSQLLLTIISATGIGFALIYFIAGSLIHNMFKEEQLARDQAIALRLARELASDTQEVSAQRDRLERWQEAAGNSCVGMVSGIDSIDLMDRQRLSKCLDAEGLQHAITTTADGIAYEVVKQNGVSTLIVWVALPKGPGQQVQGRASRLVFVSSMGPVEKRIEQTQRLMLLFMGLTVLLMCLFAYGVLTGMIVRPLGQMLRMIEHVTGGDLDARVTVSGGQELRLLANTLNRMTAALQNERLRISAHITELKLINEELARAQDRLVRSEKLASVGRLAAGIAHEVGNPISIVLGYLEMMERSDLTEEEREKYVAQAVQATKRISDIIRDLLEFSRLEKPDVNAHCDVVAVIAQTLQLLEPQARFRHVDIEFDPPTVSLREAVISAQRLQQVLVNVLLNGADATSEGKEGRIQIEVTPEKHHVTLAITDNGTGIDPTLRDRLFEPFVSTKEEGAGTGLGLSVCYSIVDAVGGEISFEDAEPDRGARCCIRLPLRSEAQTMNDIVQSEMEPQSTDDRPH